MKHSKEEIKSYYAWLREERKEAKKLSENITELDKEQLLKVQMSVPTMSWIGYYFCLVQMRKQWLSWLPWIDCKTFKLRKECWFRVKKWEKSTIHWLTWVRVSDEDDSYAYPKVYHLFHSSQVEEIK